MPQRFSSSFLKRGSKAVRFKGQHQWARTSYYQPQPKTIIMQESNELYILWTNDNPITAEKMVFMYGMNAILKCWWEKVTVIIWGATATLVAENAEMQKMIKNAQEVGVHLIACKACAAQLGVEDKLEELGVEVIYTGELLTGILKSKEALLTI